MDIRNFETEMYNKFVDGELFTKEECEAMCEHFLYPDGQKNNFAVVLLKDKMIQIWYSLKSKTLLDEKPEEVFLKTIAHRNEDGQITVYCSVETI